MNELPPSSVAMLWTCLWWWDATAALAMAPCSAIFTIFPPLEPCRRRSGTTNSYKESYISVTKVPLTSCLSRRSISPACGNMIRIYVSLIMVLATLIALLVLHRCRSLTLLGFGFQLCRLSFLAFFPSTFHVAARTFSALIPLIGSPCMRATAQKMSRRGFPSVDTLESS